MQDVTPWPESFDVSEPVARVLVDGQEVDVESVSVTSELESAMPERVAAGGGGVVAATGTASILRAEDVSEAGLNPWGDAQQFVNASEVVVEAGYRDPETGSVGCARQVTGQVEFLSGGAISNSVGLEFIDYTTLLDRNITLEPLLQVYPSLEDGGPRRAAGLSPIYVTDRILRHCGFYATPPMISHALLSAPLMGSAVPERGTLVAADSTTDTSLSVGFRATPWGVGVGNGTIRYAPEFGARGHGRFTSVLHISFLRSASHYEDPAHGYIDLRWGSLNDAVRVHIRRTGEIVVRFRSGGSDQQVVSMPAESVNSSEVFSIRCNPSGEVTIFASNGDYVTGTAPVPPKLVTDSIDEIRVDSPLEAHTIGGLQVAFSGVLYHTFERNAHLDPPAYNYSLRAFPSKIKANCLSLLKEQAEAELASMWVDEFGHFRWRNRNQLRDTPPRGTLTSEQDLFDLPWQVPTWSVFSRVELEHDVATVSLRSVPSITVSDDGGSTLSNGDTEDRFFEPPANQDWHQVADPVWLGTPSAFSYADLKRGRGSYRGGLIVNDEESLSYSVRLVSLWKRINPQRWLLSSVAQGLSSEESIEQRFRDRKDLYGKFAGENLPLIRAKGVVTWEQDTTTGAALGPSLSPVFVHKVGPWIQNRTELQSLADWLAEILTKPDVILRSVPIVPDPRIQLGDVFWLEDQSAYHMRLRVVVMGKTLTYQATHAGYQMSQEITCRVIDAERIGVRYDELQAAWEGRDYSALEAAWSGQDYAAFKADPLDRS